MSPNRTIPVKVKQAKNLSDADIDRVTRSMMTVFQDDPSDITGVLVGGDLSLWPLQIRSTVASAAIAGIVHIAYASPQPQASRNPSARADPEEILGVALSFGPGQGLNVTEEQKVAGWNAFLQAVPEGARSWWVDYYGPLRSTGAKESFGNDYVDRALKLSLFGVLPSYRGMGVGKALFLAVEAEAKARKCSIVLQTETELNVKIYTRLGFEVKKATAVQSPFGYSDFWFMEKRL
ncbi:hypothetical protein FA13DRAFT_1815143 [Coprinellus micaceus]|uniref:N-acetyltransferase domain-containing protein n=1 Tax=Coprinellus micaceus TaxID=71717 RepID=A0A4Y7T6X9_COPMI|nr:hypothetical protein FA13DRAFT_1815143 [Coprinellus micaceus]